MDRKSKRVALIDTAGAMAMLLALAEKFNQGDSKVPAISGTQKLVVKRWKRHEGCEKFSVVTRQQRRAAWRKTRMVEINKKFGPESRANRRDFALRPVGVRRITDGL